MYSEFDYLNVDVLNSIEIKLESLYKKYSNYTSKTYTAKTWKENDLIYVDEISNIETMVEYLGNGVGYPEGWITSRIWNILESNNISYKDINRLINNMDILDKANFNPLLPNDNLYPSDTLYPTNKKEE